MDDGRGLLFEFGAAVVVCVGAAILGSAFHSAPLLTVLGSLLLALLVGVVLFVLLDRRADPPLARRRLVILVVMIMGMAVGGGLIIWAVYCECAIA
jgi:amino acid transporter